MQFVEILCHERMLNFVKCPFSIYSDDHMIFTFRFVNVVYHVYWFACIGKVFQEQVMKVIIY